MVDVFLCERERMWIFANSVAKGMTVIVEWKMGIGALRISFSVRIKTQSMLLFSPTF